MRRIWGTIGFVWVWTVRVNRVRSTFTSPHATYTNDTAVLLLVQLAMMNLECVCTTQSHSIRCHAWGHFSPTKMSVTQQRLQK
jgi:hypothetical protein